jgi:RimJ/RimL family protein N-acetyltransferase
MSPFSIPAPDRAEAIARVVPVFETERLRLRAPKMADYPAYEVVLGSARARYMDGPFTPEDAFNDFCQGVAGWMLRGTGMWTVTARDADAPLGWIFLWREFGDPEDEMGWILTEAAEGQGFALEAARAVLPHAVALYGPGGFVSYIHAENLASARLAKALGAVRDPLAEAAMGDPMLYIYRHTGELQ